MSVKDFYNSITPGSTITHGTGHGSYIRLWDKDVNSSKLYEDEKLPIPESLLNEVKELVASRSLGLHM